MTMLASPEYKSLVTASSNDMIRHDTYRGMGEYEQAALHIREAGLGRVRMGQLTYSAGDYPRAAADWLSAAACFYLVPDPERMRQCVERVQQLDREGKIPADRRDIHAALKEREGELGRVQCKVDQFLKGADRFVDSKPTEQAHLEYLLPQVRDLPGLPQLHAAIALQATHMGERGLASEHLAWAEQFDPGNPDYGYHRVVALIDSGEAELGVRMGRELLTMHPGMDQLRTLLAQNIAFREGASRSAWEEAADLLKPLTEDDSADPDVRVLGLALAATLRHGLGHAAEYRRLLGSFNQSAEALQSRAARDFVTGLRETFPHIFPQPGTSGAVPSTLERHFPLNERESAHLRRNFTPHTDVAA